MSASDAAATEAPAVSLTTGTPGPARVRPHKWGMRRGRMGTGVGCLVLLGVTIAALLHVAVQARHLDVALALGKEQKLQSELLEQRRRLKSEIGRLKDPARISAIARDALKMAPVGSVDIRVVGAEPRSAEAGAMAARGEAQVRRSEPRK